MQEIDILINRMLEKSDIEKAYDLFCQLFEDALICTYNKKDFIGSNNESSYLLKSVLLSCAYKIYIQNIIN